ncbi:MAG: CPBP family intramembrane glutamic endopeptidase [Phycisphaerae bacterium]
MLPFDLSIQVLGGLLAIAWLASLVRRRQWRLPLGRSQPAVPGTELVQAFGIIAVYFGALSAMRPLFLSAVTAEQVAIPGSSAWHWVQSADAAVKLALSGLMIGMLRARGRRDAQNAGSRKRFLALLPPIGAALIAISICTLQLSGVRAIRSYFDPGSPLPPHVVLQAIRHSEWGNWGVLQLSMLAVFVAPLAEELLFRGLLLEGLRASLAGLAWPAIVVSALSFGAIHSPPETILPMITFGLILGLLRIRSGSLTACVCAHMLFNARTILYVTVAPELLDAG